MWHISSTIRSGFLASAFSLALVQLAQFAIELSDNVMLGFLDVNSFAAGALCNYIIILILVSVIGLFTAVGMMMARAIGHGDQPTVHTLFVTSHLMALLLSIPCMLLVYTMPTWITYFHHSPELTAGIRQFCHVYVWSIPGFLLFLAARELFNAAGYSRLISIIVTLSIPLNILLNALFISNTFLLGIRGIALATAAVNYLQYLAQCYLIYRHQIIRFQDLSLSCMSYPHLMKILRLGMPIFLSNFMEVSLFSMSGLLVSHFGKLPLAAFQISLQCATVPFLIFLGIAQAVSLTTNRVMSHGTRADALSIFRFSLCTACVPMTCAALIYFVFPAKLTALFISSADVHQLQIIIVMVKHFLMIAALFLTFDGLQVLLTGALRGLQDTFVPMLLGLISFWLFGLLMSYIFAYWWLDDAIGVWYGILTGMVVASVLLSLRYTMVLRQHH